MAPKPHPQPTTLISGPCPKRPRTSRQQIEPLQDQRNITSRSLRNRDEIRKKREERLLAEQEKASPEVSKTAQRKLKKKVSPAVQENEDRKKKPAGKKSGSRAKRKRPIRVDSTADTDPDTDTNSDDEAKAEDATLVGPNQEVIGHLADAIQREHQCFKSELLEEVKSLWDKVKALSTATPDFRVIGINAESLLKKILYKGFVPSDEIIRNSTTKSMSGRSGPPANTIRTADEGFNQLNRTISESNGTTSYKPGSDKKTHWSRLSDNLKRKILQNHCIILDSQEDMGDDGIFEEASVSLDSTNQTESEWQADLRKCALGNEQTFQCTIMIQAINRHRFHGFQTTLDYSIGQEWHNTFLPKLYMTKPNPSHDHISLPAPKPDLCIGFSPNKFFVNYEVEQFEIPRHLMDHLIPENSGATGDPGRIFPFLMMEVQGSASDVAGSRATHQSLNDAAHALYNMWQFMKVTPELEQKFFQSFMVFTAGGHGKEFWIKIHRPMRLETQGCPMAFQYRHIPVTRSKPYSQEVVTLYLKNAMVWSIEILLPHLRSAVDRVRQDSRERLDSHRGTPAPAERATGTRATGVAKNDRAQSIERALSLSESVNSSQRGGGSPTGCKPGRSSTRQTRKRKRRTDGGKTSAGEASGSFSVTGATEELEDSTIDDELRQRGKGNKQRRKKRGE